MINRSENICGISSRLNFKNLFCYVSIENIIVLRWLIKQMWIFFLIFQFAYFIYTFTRLSICEIDRSKKVAFPRFQSAEIRHVGISTVTFLTCMDLLCQYFILHMNNIHVLNKKKCFSHFRYCRIPRKTMNTNPICSHWIELQYFYLQHPPRKYSISKTLDDSLRAKDITRMKYIVSKFYTFFLQSVYE